MKRLSKSGRMAAVATVAAMVTLLFGVSAATGSSYRVAA